MKREDNRSEWGYLPNNHSIYINDFNYSKFNDNNLGEGASSTGSSKISNFS
jgi:hypothetical protein